MDWLRVEHEIEKPSLRLQAPVELDCDAFVAEVKKARGRSRPLSAAALRSLRDEHARTIEPARALAAEALALEHQISDKRERRLRPHAGGSRPDVANRPAADADWAGVMLYAEGVAHDSPGSLARASAPWVGIIITMPNPEGVRQVACNPFRVDGDGRNNVPG